MKFLVFGCNGMAGHLISLYLKEQGHEVLGFALSKSFLVDSVVGDACDSAFVKEIVGVDKYDTIINCVGLLNQTCDKYKDKAVYLNSYFPHYLSCLTNGTNTQVIHMSTDCVFRGDRGHYTEDDYKDGLTFYDRTKALGEIENEKDLTLRQSIVGPDINKDGIGLMNWFLQQNGEVSGYTKAIWTGQTTLQLAKTIEMAAMERVHGLYNMVPDNPISKFDLLQLFNNYLRNVKTTIIPSDLVSVDKSLKRTRWDFDYIIPDYETMIIELSEWIENHKALYPHYY